MTWILWLLALGQDDGEALRVSLPVSTAEQSYQAAVVFDDEPSVRRIVLGIPAEAVSADVVENRLFLKLLSRAEGHIDCIVASGRLYRIRVSVADASAEATDVLHVRAPPEPSAEEAETPRPLRLLRMMCGGPGLDGAARASADVLLYESKDLAIRCVAQVRAENLVGIACEIRNLSGEERTVDLSRFRGDGLLLVACRRIAIPPAGSAPLYFVFEEAGR